MDGRSARGQMQKHGSQGEGLGPTGTLSPLSVSSTEQTEAKTNHHVQSYQWGVKSTGGCESQAAECAGEWQHPFWPQPSSGISFGLQAGQTWL
jgi:hypothetical protein